MIIKETLIVRIEQIISEQIISILKIGNGVNNAVYLVETQKKKFALKIRERGLYDFFDNESTALNIMNGFIAPQLYHYENSNHDNKFMLIEYIDGVPIKSITEIGIGELASLVSEVHCRTRRRLPQLKNLKSDMQAYLNDKCYSSIPELQKISFARPAELDEVCNMVLKETEKLNYSDPEHEVLIHGDLNITNIIKDADGGWRLIDWELSRFAQVEAEIAALIWAHSCDQNDIKRHLDSEWCTVNKKLISLITLSRGLDVSTWRSKYINSLDKNSEKISWFFKELEEDWEKINILKEYI